MSKLNPQLFKVVYMPLSLVTAVDFYRHLAVALGLIPRFRKVDLFHDIQGHIAHLAYQKNTVPLIIIDEAQALHTSVLGDLRVLFNFQLDSKNLAMVLLVGQPYFVAQLNLHVHEALRNRIVVHYEFKGLDKSEVKDYITSLLKEHQCGF
ncbi:MAG: AAA family ATPase [Firmicutes bacterium]|nr:AAA family ATPase [Bacillota bacterium]